MLRTKHHTPHYPDAIGAFGLAYHLEMAQDTERVNLIKSALDETLNENTVLCELGCGTGIFSIYAAQKCKKVYAVDIDSNVLEVAKKNAIKNGVQDKMEFINSDALTVKLPEKCDVLLCEMLSIWMINEPQVPVMNYAVSNLLKKDHAIIPEKIINLAELGNMNYTHENVEIKASITQFSGMYAPRIMTESRVINEINFKQPVQENMNYKSTFISLVDGLINCARLSSIVKLTKGISFYSTDTLMPISTVPIREELNVKVGESVLFEAEYKHRSNLDDSNFSVTKGV